MVAIVQSAFNEVPKWQSQSLKTTLAAPSTPGNLVVAIAITGGRLGFTLSGSSQVSFTNVINREVRDLKIVSWYKENCPKITSFTVSADAPCSIMLWVIEFSGIAQSSALDKVVVRDSGYDVESAYLDTGYTGTTSQSDELVVGVLANITSTSTQSGFTGGLTRVFEDDSPLGTNPVNQDWERCRATIHMAAPTTTGNFRLQGTLSTARRWIGSAFTFKGQNVGPIKMNSSAVALTVGGTASLSLFGRLTASSVASAVSGTARISPFNYQYLLGGWDGLLIGQDTNWKVESVAGLDGWTVRSSDDDLPRNDGSLRGIDLQSARQIVFKVNTSSPALNRTTVEQNMETLRKFVTPQRDEDWQLIWRHPGRPLRLVNCRPTDLPGQLDGTQALAYFQAFALRAADPRIYSAIEYSTTVPVSPDNDSATVYITDCTNAGNANSYPTIQITGPTSGSDVTRVQVVNASAGVAFDVILTLQSGSELIGDMQAAVTGAARSVVTLDGNSKYGAWQQPRQAFYLAPDPLAIGGANHIYVRTTPAGAPITVKITWRDTWSG